MTSWHVEGVGDIEIRWTGFTLIDIAGHLSVTPQEARALAFALLEASVSEAWPPDNASHYRITGAYPAYEVTANGEHLDSSTELAPLMNMLRDTLNPGDSIVWAEQEPQEAAE